MGEIGVVGRGAGRMKERKTRREAARRDVVDVALNPTRRTNPVVLPDTGLTRINPTALPGVTPIPTRRKTDHTVLLEAPDAHTDPAPHTVAHIPLVLPLNHPPLSHLRWTNTLRNRMILV
jgi:hypothetical protein